MREFRPYGSVRGARSNARPYRDCRWMKVMLLGNSESAPNDPLGHRLQQPYFPLIRLHPADLP